MVAPVPVTPETIAWAKDFNDNFAALQAISVSPQSPLYAQWQHITNVAGSLHYQMRQWSQIGASGDTVRAGAGLNAMSTNVYTWLNQVNDFATQFRRSTNTTTAQAIYNKATQWAGNFRDFAVNAATATVDDFKALYEILSNAFSFLATWGPWIALGILAIFLVPPLLDAIEDPA